MPAAPELAPAVETALQKHHRLRRFRGCYRAWSSAAPVGHETSNSQLNPSKNAWQRIGKTGPRTTADRGHWPVPRALRAENPTICFGPGFLFGPGILIPGEDTAENPRTCRFAIVSSPSELLERMTSEIVPLLADVFGQVCVAL